ncbi:MAG TPA: pilus assembly protein TadG-related protein, partial [Longimicrobiales bacterium]|nr:pilus assembly protein TadG-related protein [Longimicrobiales bacterium]
MSESNGHGERIRRALRAPPWTLWRSDERGTATVVVALSMTALVALLALGIDLGALFNARSEAQRAADSAALAGASAFLEYQEAQARQTAEQRAVAFATSNEIRNRLIGSEETSVWVDLDSATVRAAIRRGGVSTWFARIFGVDAVDIGAEATAWAGQGGAAQCVKPFALPDMWE